MNAHAEPPQRPIDRWFASYSGDHRNDTNQWIHVFAVPAILWSVIALLWCIPVPIGWFKAGLWAALAMFAAWMFYWRASRALGFGMLVVFVAMATSSVTFIKLFGIGLTLAVLMDAFVIRGTLVPAFMRLAGDWNWWAPAPLRRLHDRIGISEHIDLDAEDAAAAPPAEPALVPVWRPGTDGERPRRTRPLVAASVGEGDGDDGA